MNANGHGDGGGPYAAGSQRDHPAAGGEPPVPTRAREAYRLWSASYARTSANPLTAAVDRAASRILPDLQGRTILDVGCGTGRWAARLEAAGARAIGLDPVLGMLARRPRGMPAVAADAVAIPLASDSIDGALCVLSLSHVREPGVVLAELDRVLVHGGWAVIADVVGDAHSATNPATCVR
jgi:ubiquinone/menaquinone biosynthesis C-methylase UbiE